jgi:hypothetical protein
LMIILKRKTFKFVLWSYAFYQATSE